MNKITEQEFMKLIGDYKVEVLCISFPNHIVIRNNDNDWLIWYNKYESYTNIRYRLIWSILEKKYKMNENEIELFIKMFLTKHFNMQINNIITYKFLDN